MDGFQKRTLKKKKGILDAAFTLFNQYGYKNVTISNIAKEAHVSLDTIYSYFESKENLKTELLHQIINGFCDLTENIMESDMPVKDKFKRLLLSKVDFGKRFSHEFMTEELHELNDLDLFGGAGKKEFFRNVMLQIIEQGRKGEIVTVDVSAEALTTYIEIFQYFITHNFASALQISNNADLLKEVNFLFFNGMKKKQL